MYSYFMRIVLHNNKKTKNVFDATFHFYGSVSNTWSRLKHPFPKIAVFRPKKQQWFLVFTGSKHLIYKLKKTLFIHL